MVSDWIYKLHLHRQLNYLHARSSCTQARDARGSTGARQQLACPGAAPGVVLGAWWTHKKHTKIKVRASRDSCRRLFVSPALQRQHFDAHRKHWRAISGAAMPKALGLVVVRSFRLYVCPSVLGSTPHALLNVTKFPPSPHFAISSATTWFRCVLCSPRSPEALPGWRGGRTRCPPSPVASTASTTSWHLHAGGSGAVTFGSAHGQH